MISTAIVDYGSGNLRSAAKAFERAARSAEIEARILVTDQAEIVAAADRIVLPGVGAFGDCAAGLNAVPGMREALEESVIRLGRPFLGICVGMQLMAERGIEFGAHRGLGWIKGDIVKLSPANSNLKLPHMGWNEVVPLRSHPVTAKLGDRTDVYFVHSFALAGARADQIIAETDYGGRFPAIVGRDNLIGTQFHPEKSQSAGLALIAAFLNWKP